MDKLKKDGVYEINQNMKEGLSIIYGGFAGEAETIDAIREVYDSSDYVIDTHTAVAYVVYKNYKEESGDGTATVIVSTASPFKFPKSINEALHFADSDSTEFEMVEQLSKKMHLGIPRGIQGLDKKEVLHKTTCSKDEMKGVIKSFLNI